MRKEIGLEELDPHKLANEIKKHASESEMKKI